MVFTTLKSPRGTPVSLVNDEDVDLILQFVDNHGSVEVEADINPHPNYSFNSYI